MFMDLILKPFESSVYLNLRSFLPTIAIGVLIAFFTAHALTGPHGLLLASQRRNALATKAAALSVLRDQRQSLEIRARLLRNDDLSRDLLEERAHEVLGFVGPRDYVIREAPPRG
jgi:cell division protein FtsB